MTTGDDLRKIGTGRAARSPDATPGPGPVLEPEARRSRAAVDWSGVPRERYALDRVNRLRVAALSMWGGLLGFVVGMFAALRFPDAPLAALYPFLAGGVLWGVLYLVVVLVGGGAGGFAARIYAPGSAGRRREYSLAESLAARGRYEDAVSAFELAVAEHPDDPRPYLAVARISRDHLGDVDRAARWFRRARDEATVSAGLWRAVTRELVELYRRNGRPTRAAPELARLAELHPDTPEGEWARGELADVKRLIAEDPEDPERPGSARP